MVIRRKVAKKKVAERSASQEPVADSTKSVASSIPKKKGVAVKRKETKSAAGIFTLGESLVISEVTELREKMVGEISGHDEVVLDGAKVEHIDGTGLQLLVSLMKEAVNSKTSVSWKSASDELLESAAQLGLIEILGLDKLPGAN